MKSWKESKEKGPGGKFPCLLEAENDMVIIATERVHINAVRGVVLIPGSSPNRVGYTAVWSIELFKPYSGRVVLENGD